MSLDSYRLKEQIGAGSDGVRFRASNPDGEGFVEILVLRCDSGEAEADAAWIDAVKRRLRKRRLLVHPAVPRVLELSFEHDPPYIVLEAGEPLGTLGDALRNRAAPTDHQVASIALELAEILVDAHRLGLAHGDLTADRIEIDEDARGLRVARVEFTGLAFNTFNRVRSDPEAATPDDDVKALGDLLFELIQKGDESARVDLNGNGAIVHFYDPNDDLSDLRSVLVGLIAAARSSNAIDRPSAARIAAKLRRIVSLSVNKTGADSRSGSKTATESRELSESNTLTHNESWIIVDRSDFMRFPPNSPADDELAGTRLGRFRLLEKLGRGAVGSVYKAEDLSDGSIVAIKVLRFDLARTPDAIRRFRKEARILAEIRGPYVTNLIEVNEDGDVHYLVLEYVEGEGLDKRLAEKGSLPETEAIAIMAQTARALEEPHERGIVHRDIKPQNILLSRRGDDESAAADRVKLSDFGLSRHVIESESLQLTRVGTILGTPLYIAPEQCMGRSIGPAADVYAMGATLFHLLAGRPPFLAETAFDLIAKHGLETPPQLKTLNRGLSDGICRVVDKALVKDPERRYPNAAAFRADLERLLRGEPTGIDSHPKLPQADPESTIVYDWTWDLRSPPSRLWPFVSNTERFNRAVGLPAVQFSTKYDADMNVHRFGRFRRGGIEVAWEERPFEWIEARRMGVLREYVQGPWLWIVSVVDLSPRPDGGTTLTHRFRIAPRNLAGRWITAINIGRRSKKAFDSVYRRIDSILAADSASAPAADPFEPEHVLIDSIRPILERRLEATRDRGVDREVVAALGEFLATAADQELEKIRPVALAERLGIDLGTMINACLHAAQTGLLVLRWDLICPICRIASDSRDSLGELGDHSRCEACALDYPVDFADTVEMIFRIDPSIRRSESRTYCIGGPAHSPHVVAQLRLAPEERFDFDLELAEGSYRLRGPQLPFHLDLRVRSRAAAARIDWDLGEPSNDDSPRSIRAGRIYINLYNPHRREVLIRLERRADRSDAFTAARAAASATFRSLFPRETLAPGRLVGVKTIAFVVTELVGDSALYADGDDSFAFGVIHAHFRLIEDRVRREGGALVKTIGSGTISVFDEPLAAVRAALAIPGDLAADPIAGGLEIKVGVERGGALMTTINDRLDYFGRTVDLASRLPNLAEAGEIVLGSAIASEPEVVALLADRKIEPEPIAAENLAAPRFATKIAARPGVDPTREKT
jgi:serine/threonine protein kinase/class 3 adenylate cyclase